MHDAGIGPDAVNRLDLLSIRTALLEHLAVSSIWIVLIRHIVEMYSLQLDL